MKLLLDRSSGILVTQACGNEEGVGRGDGLSFEVDGARPTYRNKEQGHVPLRTMGMGSQGPLLPIWRNRPGKGTLQEQGPWW